MTTLQLSLPTIKRQPRFCETCCEITDGGAYCSPGCEPNTCSWCGEPCEHQYCSGLCARAEDRHYSSREGE